MTRQGFTIRYVWPPILIAVVLGAIAVFSVVAQEAWLAPSLASAVFSQMLHPDESGAEPVNIRRAGDQHRRRFLRRLARPWRPMRRRSPATRTS